MSMIERLTTQARGIGRILCMAGAAAMVGLLSSPASAETITIGSGTGIVWTGLPFSGAWRGAQVANYGGPWAMLIITANNADTNSGFRGMRDSLLTTIAGYRAYPIAPGVGIIPRARATARYRMELVPNTDEIMTATIGLPETRATTSTGYTITNPLYVYNYVWFLPVRSDMTKNIPEVRVVENSIRTTEMSGDWVMVADGTQTTRQITLPSFYGGSYAPNGQFNLRSLIFPSNVTLRISSLACTVATTTAINFGNVERNTTADSELASRTYPLGVSCSQDTDRINANINVQFRSLSGLYGNSRYRLALAQGNGYITGEIDNGVTGSGACNLNTGIPFDDTQLKVGDILATDTSKTFSHQVTWRLCSGGANLPTGPVNASAEMLVTFN